MPSYKAQLYASVDEFIILYPHLLFIDKITNILKITWVAN